MSNHFSATIPLTASSAAQGEPVMTILRVPCPKCHATPGQRCADDNGKRSDPHLARYSAERDAFLVEQGWQALGLKVVTP